MGVVCAGHHTCDSYMGVVSAGHHTCDSYMGVVCAGHHTCDSYMGVVCAGHHTCDSYMAVVCAGHHTCDSYMGVVCAGQPLCRTVCVCIMTTTFDYHSLSYDNRNIPVLHLMQIFTAPVNPVKFLLTATLCIRRVNRPKWSNVQVNPVKFLLPATLSLVIRPKWSNVPENIPLDNPSYLLRLSSSRAFGHIGQQLGAILSGQFNLLRLEVYHPQVLLESSAPRLPSHDVIWHLFSYFTSCQTLTFSQYCIRHEMYG